MLVDIHLIKFATLEVTTCKILTPFLLGGYRCVCVCLYVCLCVYVYEGGIHMSWFVLEVNGQLSLPSPLLEAGFLIIHHCVPRLAGL